MRADIAEASNWRGPAIANGAGWIRHFDDAHLEEIEAALRSAQAGGINLENCTAEDFPLPGFDADLAKMRGALEDGLGLQLYRGFPVERYSRDELRLIYWALGLHIGWVVSQSKHGDRLGDVRDIGTPKDGPDFRGYTSSGELTFHTDAADITGLFCLCAAKSGGVSRIVSAAAVHNEIRRLRPDLLKILYRPYWWSRQGNERPGEEAYYTQPIFAEANGYLASRYTPTHIRSATEAPGVPAITPVQTEALELVEEISARPEFYLEMNFAPGDIQFVNNHLTYHMRTEFEDHDEADRRRHLLRLWLSIPNSRPLSEGFRPFFGDIRGGVVHGGFPGHGEPIFATA